MSALFKFLFLIFIYVSVNDVVSGLSQGVRCRDPHNEKFLFYYESDTVAYICKDQRPLRVTGYQGGCKHEGLAVFRFKNDAWQTCLDGVKFTDVACVFDEECGLKSSLISEELEGWNTSNTTRSCNVLRELLLTQCAIYKRIISKFSTCRFGDYVAHSIDSVAQSNRGTNSIDSVAQSNSGTHSINSVSQSNSANHLEGSVTRSNSTKNSGNSFAQSKGTQSHSTNHFDDSVVQSHSSSTFRNSSVSRSKSTNHSVIYVTQRNWTSHFVHSVSHHSNSTKHLGNSAAHSTHSANSDTQSNSAHRDSSVYQSNLDTNFGNPVTHSITFICTTHSNSTKHLGNPAAHSTHSANSDTQSNSANRDSSVDQSNLDTNSGNPVTHSITFTCTTHSNSTKHLGNSAAHSTHSANSDAQSNSASRDSSVDQSNLDTNFGNSVTHSITSTFTNHSQSTKHSGNSNAQSTHFANSDAQSNSANRDSSSDQSNLGTHSGNSVTHSMTSTTHSNSTKHLGNSAAHSTHFANSDAQSNSASRDSSVEQSNLGTNSGNPVTHSITFISTTHSNSTKYVGNSAAHSTHSANSDAQSNSANRDSSVDQSNLDTDAGNPVTHSHVGAHTITKILPYNSTHYIVIYSSTWSNSANRDSSVDQSNLGTHSGNSVTHFTTYRNHSKSIKHSGNSNAQSTHSANSDAQSNSANRDSVDQSNLDTNSGNPVTHFITITSTTHSNSTKHVGNSATHSTHSANFDAQSNSANRGSSVDQSNLETNSGNPVTHSMTATSTTHSNSTKHLGNSAAHSTQSGNSDAQSNSANRDSSVDQSNLDTNSGNPVAHSHVGTHSITYILHYNSTHSFVINSSQWSNSDNRLDSSVAQFNLGTLSRNSVDQSNRGINSGNSVDQSNSTTHFVHSNAQTNSDSNFGNNVTQSSLVTHNCSCKNYSHSSKKLSHDPEDCRNGPDKHVFFVDNRPKYCIIRTRDAFNGLCLPMGRLWEVLKTNYSTYDNREHTSASNFEYKRFAMEEKVYMYKTDYGYRNEDLKKIFTTPAVFLSTIYPEVHRFQLDEVKVGANVFCELALKLFPIENYQIYKALLPQECPRIKRECVKRGSADLLNSDPYPKNLYKIWYNKDKLPKKCFLHKIFHRRTDDKNYCINFTAGINLIKTRENNRASHDGHKDNYQASLVRVLRDPPNYQTPWHLHFNKRRTEPLAKVLLEMAEALGYYNEQHKVEFTVGAEILKMGASTFCSILTEMIPFSTAEFNGAMEEC